MKALPDTHTFLWFISSDPRLGDAAREILLDDSNEVLMSAVVPWEISIKYAAGRLPEMKEHPHQFVLSRMATGRLQRLPIDIEHALRTAELPPIHRDPFDRMLVAQAQIEGLVILTSDPHIRRYDVEVAW